MQETRRMRLQSVIQKEISLVVAREVKDPRIPTVTFTAVEVTQDGSHATIFVSILGGVKEGYSMQECLQGLKSASGYLKRHLAKVLNVKNIPQLFFKEDRGFENSIRVQELLRDISKPSKPSDETE